MIVVVVVAEAGSDRDYEDTGSWYIRAVDCVRTRWLSNSFFLPGENYRRLHEDGWFYDKQLTTTIDVVKREGNKQEQM